MDTVLLVAMIHLACISLVSLHTLPIFLYRDQALRSFRQAVTKVSQDNTNAVRSASHLLAAVSFAADRVTEHPGLWATNWLALAVGQRNFTNGIRGEEEKGGDRLYPSDEASEPAIICPYYEDILPTQESDDDWAHRGALYEIVVEIGRFAVILKRPHEQSFKRQDSRRGSLVRCLQSSSG